MSRRIACVFHIHTRHSFDCMASPSGAVRWAQRHNIRALGITDHDTIRGAQEAARYSLESGVQVIIGAEYATNQGDVIGLFLREEIRSHDAFEVIEGITGQGGISVLPHPYHGHRLTEQLAEAVDVIEVFNARCSDSQNGRALELARSRSKPMIAGADAHFLKDLGHCICYFETEPVITPDSFLHAHRAWIGKPSPRTRLYWSQAIKAVKTGDRSLLKANLRAVLLTYLRATLGKRVYSKLREVSKQQG